MKEIHDRVIAFRPRLARELGDIQSAIFYAQLWYWRKKGKRSDGYIYKSKAEIEEETTLTRDQQDRIRKKLVSMGWLDTKLWRANAHATLHYKCLIDPREPVDSGVRTSESEPKTLHGKWETREQ